VSALVCPNAEGTPTRRAEMRSEKIERKEKDIAWSSSEE
jgi:hypothetical protein